MKIKYDNTKVNLETDDFVYDYLINLGIDPFDVNSLLQGPFDTDVDDWRGLDNIYEAIVQFHKLITEVNLKNIFLQVDSDVDGYTSSAIMYSYLKTRYPDLNIHWRLHSGKEHGVIVESVPEECNIVIIPDAGSMQLEEQKRLDAMGKYIFILDHHTVTDFSNCERLWLVNNQCGNFKNPNLSGAGVVWMFIKGYDEMYYNNNPIYENYMDLAALGIIADMMKTECAGNNYIIRRGLSHIENKMLQELLKKQSYHISDISSPNKIDIAFYIAPLINGLIRSGEQDEKEMFFKAMIDNNITEPITTVYRGIERVETIYEYAARIAGNAKSRQDAAKKKSISFLKEKIINNKLDENKILVVCIENKELTKVNQNITGLAAMELVKEYNKPTLILREDDKNHLYCGSGRSKNWEEIPSLLDFIRDSGYSDFAEGHGNAFGVWFDKNRLNDFIHYSNEKLKDADYDNQSIEVYYYFKNQFNLNMLQKFADVKDLYGNGIPQPKFAFEFDINKYSLRTMGKEGHSLKISGIQGLDFVMLGGEDAINQFNSIKGDHVHVTLVGRPQINEFNGLVNLQVMIDNCEFSPSTIPSRRNLLDLF